MIKIIAEIGCNHNGSKELARKMVAKAKECGADAIKFQTFSADALISKYAPKAKYQEKTTGTEDSQLEMTQSWNFPRRISWNFVSMRSLWVWKYSLHHLIWDQWSFWKSAGKRCGRYHLVK